MVEQIKNDTAADNCINKSLKFSVYGFAAGIFMGSFIGSFDAAATKLVPNAPTPYKAASRLVGTAAIGMTLVAGTYAMGECIGESIRGKKDVVNSIIGGAFASSVIMVKTASLKAGVTFFSTVAVLQTVHAISGGFRLGSYDNIIAVPEPKSSTSTSTAKSE
eukprot:TRINITY_DN38225_c0_g1_i1.p1 TRINITY_DN38225_c0_g1~~TRINITY_DN38225_c0_g1_i1.p1  ORF type:complete len:175 (+),score=46.12 TRINITY_DN38225_c0_g1_i1:40-525(+)